MYNRIIYIYIYIYIYDKKQLYLTIFFLGALGLSCYECENCAEHPAYLNEKVRECPDTSYVSCIKTESKFAHYTGEWSMFGLQICNLD